MKPTLPILAGLLAFAAPLGAQNIKIDIDPNKSAQPAAQPAKPAAAQPAAAQPAAQGQQRELVPPQADGKYTNAQLMEVYGFIVGSRLQLRQQITPLIGDPEELVGFLRGVGLSLTGTEPAYDGSKIGPQTEAMVKSRTEIVQAQIQKQLAELKEKNTKLSNEFLTTLDAKPGVKKASSGLRYEIIAEGKSTKAKTSQAVMVNFKASVIDGTVFDGTDEKTGPRELVLETSIPGLKEGLQLVGVGGKVKLYIPSEIGFGDDARILAPGMLMIFEVEILEIKEPTKQPEEKK